MRDSGSSPDSVAAAGPAGRLRRPSLGRPGPAWRGPDLKTAAAQEKPAEAPGGSTVGASPKPPKEGFRPDVEGLRAVAVGAVLLYHAGVPFAPGGYVGVDVFFVISGFLITGLLVRELEKTGRHLARALLLAARQAPAAPDCGRAGVRGPGGLGVAAVRPRAHGRGLLGSGRIRPLRHELAARRQGHRLLRGRVAGEPGPALLDAGGRGAVLPDLAGPPPGRRLVEPPRGLGLAAGARGGLRGRDCRLPSPTASTPLRCKPGRPTSPR